jgi:hypothetical protein
MKMTVFWVVAPCTSVSEVLAASIIRAASTSETLVNFYQTTWHNIPEDRHLLFSGSLSLCTLVRTMMAAKQP